MILSLLLLLSVIFLITSVCVLKNYISPPLTGKWISSETGEIVTFKKDGSIDVGEQSNVATYKIIEPNLMEYTIDDKVFIMTYSIEGRVLNWGIKGNESEVFHRR